MNFLTTVSRQMTRFTALIIVLASIIAFIEPATFSWVKGDTQVIVLGIIMLGMGMTLGKEDYQILAQRPLDIFIGAIAQYTIMPMLAIGIARAFDLSPGLTLGLVLVGTCPGGVSSNIMSFLAKGDDGGKDDNQGGEAGHLPTDSGQKVHVFTPLYVFIMTIIAII